MRQFNWSVLVGFSGAAVLAGTLSQAWGFGGNNGTICPQPVGPDVIVGNITDVGNYVSLGDLEAFALGTESCNIGNMNVAWQAANPNHPVIGQSIFKLKDGQFQQLGISWLKHGFTALTNNICGCGCSGQGGSVLGVGCSDPYVASLNGDQSNLGPRWQVNAAKGVFPYPPANPSFSGSVARRIQVHIADLEPSSPTILYFGEGQYVTHDDAMWGNQNNNASYRPLTITGGGTAWSGTVMGSTMRMEPGIRAWHDTDPTVTETSIQNPGDGLFILSAKATNLGGIMWHYEYALQNVNSDASGQSFNIPIPSGATITNIGFHDVDYHDGDGPGNVNFDGTDWNVTNEGTICSWATQTSQNPSANALRWGTLYNFRFDADRPPQSGTATIGLFKVPGSVSGATVVPGPDCNQNNVADAVDIANGTSVDANANGIPDECEICIADLAPRGGNGTVNVDDLLVVINSWGPCADPNNCPADIAPTGGNGMVDVDDLLAVINAWGPCP